MAKWLRISEEGHVPIYINLDRIQFCEELGDSVDIVFTNNRVTLTGEAANAFLVAFEKAVLK